jgi:maltose alpha-D-glucosyltransferase/alpha-amylase
MLLQGYLANQGDGWQYTLGFLQRYLESSGTQEGFGAYLSLIQTLGARTAELHRAFATRSGNPAFDPEPFGAQDMQEWKARVVQEAQATFALLKKDLLDDARRNRILERIESCQAPQRAALKTRHHGDYHLGQVLWTGEGWIVIDFEGEPARSLPERRRKRSPLRDVAGMLRSFAYVASAAEIGGGPPPPEGWEESARREFLDGYRDTIDPALVPTGDNFDRLLAIFELEKAVYELRYELDNRPDWVPIPVAGIVRLLESAF